jgi:Cdc6-like AAA superfamily ATPase
VPGEFEATDLDDQFSPGNRIQQDATGDRNQVIGRVSDSTIVNAGEGQVINLTVHDRIPQSSVPLPVVAPQSLSQQEYRQRKVLLNKVKEYWVKGVLEKSLHSTTLIELGLEERTDVLENPFDMVNALAVTSATVLPEGSNATMVFNQMETGRTMLILGEPGSGKTITLLKLAQDLIVRSEEDLGQPIPVVFNLSSWAKKKSSIAAWVIQEIVEKYQVSKALGKTWVEEQQLILLLDGLDEVQAESRDACVRSMNQFTETYGLTELVICCRIQDYQALSERLRLRSAICVQPLTSDQIEQYLSRSGSQLAMLQTVLREDAGLRELAASPLILNVMSLAYQNAALDAFPKPGTTDELYKQLFDVYVDRMLQRRGGKLAYSKEQTLRWLSWLAKRMTQENQTVFLIELMQPHWLDGEWRKTTYHLLSGLVVGIITALLFVPALSRLSEVFTNIFESIAVMLVGGISIGLIWGVGFLILGERIGSLASKRSLSVLGGLAVSCIAASQGGGIDSIYSFTIFLTLSGLIGFAIYAWLRFFFFVVIKPVETLKWSWNNAKAKSIDGALWGLLLGLIFGISIGITYGAIFSSIFDAKGALEIPSNNSFFGWTKLFSTPLFLALVNSFVFGIIFEIMGGLLGGLIGGLSGTIVNDRSSIPNQGIWQSAKSAIILSLIGLSCLSIAFTLIGSDWIVGGFLGILIGVSSAGIACIQHGVLRLLLYLNKFSPWNYARFLDYSTDCALLQKVGGSYIFVHRLLLEYFASIKLP